MRKRNRWAAMGFAALIGAASLACGDGVEDRSALEQDELDRDLELALQGDSTMATFEDTIVAQDAAEPEPETPAAQPAPRPSTPRPRPSAPVEDRTPDPAPTPAPQPRVVTSTAPVGTTFNIRLNEELSTQTNRAGDSFLATLDEPILGDDGSVVVPAGATVRGRVTGVQKSGRVGETAVLSLAFETVSFAGESYALDATVVRADPERVSRESTGEQVGKVAAGAAAGAILGRVLGKNTSSTIKGAVIGAAAGTAIAMGTADVDAVLKQGSIMTIRLDSPIRVTRTIS